MVVAIAFAIFVANAVYMGGIKKALNSSGNTLHLSAGGATAFLWIDSIIAAILGIILIYLVYKEFAKSKTSNMGKTHEMTPTSTWSSTRTSMTRST